MDVYRERWQWWMPWNVTRPWLPRFFRGGDEFCNPSIGLVIPPLGCLVIFYKPGRMRTHEDGWCETCRAEWFAETGIEYQPGMSGVSNGQPVYDWD